MAALRIGRRFHARIHLTQLRQFLRRRQPREFSAAVEDRAHRNKWYELLQRQRFHGEAEIRRAAECPVGCQTVERLAQRRAAHAQPRRQMHFVDRSPSGNPPPAISARTAAATSSLTVRRFRVLAIRILNTYTVADGSRIRADRRKPCRSERFNAMRGSVARQRRTGARTA